jgi:hypothetical protein
MKRLRHIVIVTMCLFLFLSILPLSGCKVSASENKEEKFTQLDFNQKQLDFNQGILDLITLIQGEVETLSEENLEKQALIEELTRKLEEVAPEPPKIPLGFTPDPKIIDIRNEVDVLVGIPEDLSLYKKFFDVKGVWGEPRGGYGFAYNDAPRDNTRRENIQLTTFAWMVITGEELWIPGIGSIKDSLGGESLLVIFNAWEAPTEFIMAYILHGCWITGRVFNMSDLTDNPAKYGDYTLESIATLRNHYLYHLTTVDESGYNFVGHTGRYLQADSVTYVLVIRWYDGSFRLVEQGQYVKQK